ncbi:alkaline phosphatase D family protein [Beijerinckia mobilis]|uniref:alkaline phosphatase D family protein n=1 Tax=Beijerinckia mobilis TaxID=231434 RepID=UPI000559483D|nr:alkaline phosphatase D family protein [Beijerinckia mobilis]
MSSSESNRRQFLRDAGVSLGLGTLGLPTATFAAPAIVAANRPSPLDLQTGDPSHDGIQVWARADSPGRMIVEVATDPEFRHVLRRQAPLATEATDLTSRLLLNGLAPGQAYHVRVAFELPDGARGPGGSLGPWMEGTFRTPSVVADRPVRFLWSGDMNGQGWGINPEIGGTRMHETMRQRDPDFFVHNGDTIYADGPILPEVTAENGQIWKNVVTEEVSKVAETLKEYRGRHRYTLLDDNVRRFARQVPQVMQWDDHEICNNWSESKDISADTRYTEKDVRVLVSRGRRAFLENAPMRWQPATFEKTWASLTLQENWELDQEGLSHRVYRTIPYGPLVEVFVLDMRTYRGANSYNLQTTESKDTAFIGNEQLEWLVNKLAFSRATWKVISADMPIGLYVSDGKDAEGRAKWEAIANGVDGPAAGRELEIGRLLTRIKQAGVRNVVWITTDVHYCAAHHYHPDRAFYKNFDPFWEFVAGPLNAGSFGPNALDETFGPELVFQKAPPYANASPLAGYQFFGEINIDPYSRALTVDLRDLDGVSQFTKTLQPQR